MGVFDEYWSHLEPFVKHQTTQATQLAMRSPYEKENSPRPMHNPTRLNHHSHDCVLVRPPSFPMNPNDFIDPDITHKISHDEDEVGSNDSSGVNIAHGVTRGERLF